MSERYPEFTRPAPKTTRRVGYGAFYTDSVQDPAPSLEPVFNRPTPQSNQPQPAALQSPAAPQQFTQPTAPVNEIDLTKLKISVPKFSYHTRAMLEEFAASVMQGLSTDYQEKIVSQPAAQHGIVANRLRAK